MTRNQEAIGNEQEPTWFCIRTLIGFVPLHTDQPSQCTSLCSISLVNI
jgi:hypothetical protein